MFPFKQCLTVAFVIFEIGLPVPVALAESICPTDVDEAIKTIIKQAKFERSRWGILVQTLNSEEKLYGLEEKQYFTVASNVKLFTTAAVLHQLGSDFRIRTVAYGQGKLPYLQSLRVVGGGDPSLTTEKLQDLVQQLKEKGVNHINQLIVEDSYFPEPVLNYSWEWSDLWYYYAPSVNSLILNENAVILKLIPQAVGQPVKLEWSDGIAGSQWQVNNQTITGSPDSKYTIELENTFTTNDLNIRGELAVNREDVNGLSIPHPDQYFADSLRNLLVTQDITVKQIILVQESLDDHPSLGEELAVVESPQLIDLVTKTNQDSNNLFAETLLRILGNESQQTGVNAVTNILTNLGVNQDSFKLVDGSGLSRQNLVSPEALVQLLILMAHSKEGKNYRNSLPVAGISGTLQSRFKDTAIMGNLQAKSGTLTGVSALSGYLDVPNYQPLVFSIVVNHSTLSAKENREAIEEIVSLLFNLKKCN